MLGTGDVYPATYTIPGTTNIRVNGRLDGVVEISDQAVAIYRPGPIGETLLVTYVGSPVPSDARFLGAVRGYCCWAVA